MKKENCIAITGAPGTGKSSLIQRLSSLGFECVSEPAREIIAQQRKMGGEGIPDRNPSLFTDLLLDRAIDCFTQAPSDKPVFFDRGLPDVACYAALFKLDLEKYLEAARRYRHHSVVFLAPPWPEIYENDDERKMTFALAKEWSATFAAVYSELGYEVVSIPLGMSVNDRAKFVLGELGVGPTESFT